MLKEKSKLVVHGLLTIMVGEGGEGGERVRPERQNVETRETSLTFIKSKREVIRVKQ